jgi:hypothetical protein
MARGSGGGGEDQTLCRYREEGAESGGDGPEVGLNICCCVVLPIALTCCCRRGRRAGWSASSLVIAICEADLVRCATDLCVEATGIGALSFGECVLF